METVTRFAERQTGAMSSVLAPNHEAARALSVTAIYLLSEDGRKASLLNGGDGRAVQRITLQVPANRLHLVAVDQQGIARLKLRPRYEVDGAQHIVRLDAAPLYDAPPTIDELYRAAAKNHEFEATYFAARDTARSRRSETERAFRETIAEAFLTDRGQRAISHPPPTLKRCYLDTDRGRILFDVGADQGRAKEVPVEAHRRFRSDLRERDERNRQQRAAQLKLHEEKKQYVNEWIAANGTDEQKRRQAAGMLPMDEAIQGITDEIFAIGVELPVYVHDGANRLQTFLRKATGEADVVVAPADVIVRSGHAVKATAAQWAAIQQLRERVVDASVVLREHVLSSKSRQPPNSLTVFGALVTKKHGPFVLRREYVVGESIAGK